MKIFIFLLLIGVLSCNRTAKNSFAIKDFSEKLQPYLHEVVSNGIVGYDTATRFIQEHATDKELTQLSHSEHPVLRAVAFRAMLDRPSFDHFALIMNNLDDTAIVATDAGEWGIQFHQVSDELLRDGKWKDTASRNKTLEEVILHHNNLRSVYIKLEKIETKPAYYSYIKQMAQREYNESNLVGRISFYERECALIALAKYRKPEDILIIKEWLLTHMPEMGELSYQLMSDYPDELYMEVFESFYPKKFYRLICTDRNLIKAGAFINSITSYKNGKSARILDSMLNRKPFIPCSLYPNYIRSEIVSAIMNNTCDAYAKLIKQVAPEWKRYPKDDVGIPSEPVIEDSPKAIPSEPVGWW